MGKLPKQTLSIPIFFFRPVKHADTGDSQQRESVLGVRTIVWFRGKDLRISDHRPLTDAIASGEVIPLFVLDPYFFAPDRAAELPHRMQYLLDSLRSLAANIEHLGSRLILLEGRCVDLVPRAASEWRADRVVAHRWVEPFGRERDRRIAKVLGNRFVLYEGETLHPPGTLRTATQKPHSVFTHFARSFHRLADIEAPISAPSTLPPLPPDITKESRSIPTCKDLQLQNNSHLQRGGERAARERLEQFLKNAGEDYKEGRNRMDQPEATSRLSADIKFGTLSIRQVFCAARDGIENEGSRSSYMNELVWREFAHSTLWDRPKLLEEPFRPEFSSFPWDSDRKLLQAWAEGQTGYPVVDASARQLLHEGFVHNRARMVSASFLTKHLLIDYRLGEAHYLKYLTDGDWAQNNAGWQWSAGCGCDAQPYFRVFNPTLQGKRFDPTGDYVRHWVPELRKLPTRFIHEPWRAPPEICRNADLVPGKSYPKPLIEHRFARERFLELAKHHLKKRPV